MRSTNRKSGAAAGVLSVPVLDQPQFSFEGESLIRFLKLAQREIESTRALDEALPYKFWIKQQFAVGVNEVTRVLERMPSTRGTKLSAEMLSPSNGDDAEAANVCLQAILVSDCNPRWLTKHLPALSASRSVPLIFIKDRKEGSLKLGKLINLKTAIAIGIKAKGNAVNQLIKEVLAGERIDNIEA